MADNRLVSIRQAVLIVPFRFLFRSFRSSDYEFSQSLSLGFEYIEEADGIWPPVISSHV